jgi:hypothetical protein
MQRAHGPPRDTAASREVAVLIRDDADVVERPKPPAELSAEEADEWIALCNAVPATYFPASTHMVLVQYCRHVVIARHLSELIRRTSAKKKFDLRQYRQLIREHRAESVAIQSCLRQMRLTHMATYQRDRSPIPEPAPRPWLS